MQQECTGLRVSLKWKLEKFDGDRKDGDTPVEVIEGEDELSPEQVKELCNGTDQRGT